MHIILETAFCSLKLRTAQFIFLITGNTFFSEFSVMYFVSKFISTCDDTPE